MMRDDYDGMPGGRGRLGRYGRGSPPAGARTATRPVAGIVARVAGVIAVTGSLGCATTAPYERGTLARTDMQLERNGDLSAGQQHADAYREGSAGGLGSSGGGCGCN